MKLIPLSEVTASFATHAQADARYEVLRDLIPMADWPVALYTPTIIQSARIRRASEKNAIDPEAYNPAELIQTQDEEAVREIRAHCYAAALEEPRMVKMFATPFLPYTPESVLELATQLRAKITPTSRRGAHEVTLAQLATLAWIAGVEGGLTDEQQANLLLAQLNMEPIRWNTDGDVQADQARL